MDTSNEKEPLLSASGETESGSTRKSTNEIQFTKILTVEPIIILAGYCMTATIPLLEQYGYAKLAVQANASIIPTEGESNCNANESDPIHEEQQQIQAKASDFFMIIMLLTSLPNIVVVSVFMFLSDIFGRRPILITNLFFMLIGYIEWVIFVQFNQPLSMLFIGAATFGVFGIHSYMTISLAYLADISHHSDRSYKMMIFEVCICISSILANVTTGFLIK